MWSGDPLRHLWNFNAMHRWRSSSTMSQIFSPSIDIDINVNVSSAVTESPSAILTSQHDPMQNAEKGLSYNDTATILVSPLAMGVPQAIATAISLSAIMIGTVVGNVLVILSVFTYKPLRNVQNMFIVSLAVADIAVAVCVMPFNVAYSIIGRWVFGLRMCEMWLTCDVLCCTASILNLCAIALDRYWAIHDPINYAQKRTLNRVLFMILLVWIFSALISVPPLIGWNDWPDTFTDTTPCKLTEEKGYIIYSSSGSFYIPLVIMTTVYLKIFQATRRRLRERAKAQAAQLALKKKEGSTKSENIPMKNMAATAVAVSEVVTTDGSSSSTQKTPHSSPTNQANNASQDSNDGKDSTTTETPEVNKNGKKSGRPNNSNVGRRTSLSPALTVRQYMEEKQRISLSRERRAARILGIVMGVFVLCWLPFFLMYIVLPFCDGCYVSDNMVNFITWLGYMNSALNPVIYTVFNKDFRESFRRLLCNKR